MSQDSRSAEVVFLGDDIRTMNPDAPKASALAIRSGRIVALDADAKAMIGPNTNVYRLGGKTLTPGLVDGHCHLYGLGKTMVALKLRDLPSAEAVAAKVAETAPKLEAASWVVGRGWDQNLWASKEFPRAAQLDAVEATRPVALRRVDGHALWANTAAMAIAGITDSTADPAGGKIERDENGKATGIFIDSAIDLVEAKIPAPTTKEIEDSILRAANRALSLGLSEVHEMGISDRVISVYRGLASQKRLPIRVYAYKGVEAKDMESAMHAVPDVDKDGDHMFIVRGIKMYADGALGSRGAALLADYSDDAGNRGLWISSEDELQKASVLAASKGWQLAVHAIGDAGNRAVLNAFENAAQKYPGKDLRFRVEHAQILEKSDIPRFGNAGIIASVQPTHATSDMPWAEERLGAERIHGAYPWKSLIDSGARVVSGSDFPVERVSPLLGLYAAVSRQDAKAMPVGGWLPQERMSLDEALSSFTFEAAFAAFAEEARGQLAVGYVADFTVFDRALEANAGLLQTGIEMVWVEGAIRFQAE